MSFGKKILLSLMRRQDVVNIVQIGANDGKINDPIYETVTAHPKKSRILLIEPQPELIPFLRGNYKDHGSVLIFNGAIGPNKSLSLYRVKPDLWKFYNPPYMKNAPFYRVPSGFTSASKSHVVNHCTGNFLVDLPIDECIEEIKVPCRTLMDFAGEISFINEIDFLQIDTEGKDDETVYSCDIGILKPRIINYEYVHLGQARHEELMRYLAAQGYKSLIAGNTDATAIRYEAFDQTLSSAKLVSSDSACPCGSNKRYKHCHGLDFF